MTTNFQDTFTDTDPTLLTTHNADTGQPWASSPSIGSGNGNADEFIVRGNRLRRVNWDDVIGYNGGGEALAYPVGVTPLQTIGTYDVTFTLLCGVGATNSQLWVYHSANEAFDPDNQIGWLSPTADQVYLGNASPVAYSFTLGQVYAVRLNVAGNTVALYIDEVLVTSRTGTWGTHSVPTAALGIDIFDTAADSFLSIDGLTISSGPAADFWTNRIKTTETP
jgi:hypothetical protein